MKTIENNKLIAEFMGYQINYGFNKDGVLFHGVHVSADKLLYATNWDWLMPVVEKIETEKFKVHEKFSRNGKHKQAEIIIDLFYDSREEFKGWNYNISFDFGIDIKMFDGRYETKIESLYNATIETIKFINKYK